MQLTNVHSIALLLTLSEEELERCRVSSPAIATLLVCFPSGSRRAGVFCCFVVHLIRHCGWDLLLNAKEPLHRNCIKLQLTDDKKYWCCDVDPDISGLLESHHLIWFGISQGMCFLLFLWYHVIQVMLATSYRSKIGMY